MQSPRPSLEVAVVMRKERLDNRWQPWRWSLADVVPQESGFGTEPRLLLKNDDEAEGGNGVGGAKAKLVEIADEDGAAGAKQQQAADSPPTDPKTTSSTAKEAL